MIEDIKKLGKQTIIYGIGDALSRVSAFLLLPIYTTYLSPRQFGILEILYMTSTVMAILLGRQLAHATLRFYFEYDEILERNKVVSSSFIIFISLCGAVLGLCMLFSGEISEWMFSSREYAKHFTVLFIWLLISLSNEILYTYLRATERAYIFIMISFCELIIKLATCIYLVVSLQWAEFGVLCGNLVGASTTFVLIGSFTMYKCGTRVDVSVFKRLVTYTLPLVFVGVCGTIIGQADRFFLKTFTSLTEVGLYALGMRFASIVQFLVITPFTQGYGPFRFSIMKKENAPRIYSRVTTYFLFFFLWACLAVTAFAREVIQIMADESYWQSYRVVPILMLSILGQGLFYMFQIGIYLNKSTKVLIYVYGAATIFNLAMLQLLVPRYGMIGAACAIAATQLLISLLGLYCSNKLYVVPYEWGRILKDGIIYLFLSMIVSWEYSGSPYWSALMKAPFVLVYPLLLWGLRYFHPDEIAVLRKTVLQVYNKRNG